MKIVLLCNGQHNQVALANRIAGRFQLEGIVVEKALAEKKKQSGLSVFFEKILNVTLFAELRKTWFGMLEHYRNNYPSFPQTQLQEVSNINSTETINFIQKIKPDLLMVSGTTLIRKKILELPIPFGIINLHTGLSPYIKGGPNCTNWCIAENKFHLIGNTIMWIDAGIDSGDLLTTALTPISGNESLLQVHIKVMDHAHELYLAAVEKIANDREHCPRVKQSLITEGTTYYNKQWNFRKKRALLRNFKKMPLVLQSEQYRQQKDAVVTIHL